MGRAYATTQDMTELWRPMTPAETTRAEALLPIVSAELRIRAARCGKDLDDMVDSDEDLADIARSVTVDVTARQLLTSTSDEPMTQYTQSALGYSVSGTYLVPGGGIYIKKSELARLGLKTQKIGVIELYGYPRDDS